RERSKSPRLFDSEDAIIPRVGDVDVSGRVRVDAMRLFELGLFGAPVQYVSACDAGSGDGGDGAFAHDVFADPVVLGIGDQDVARRIQAQVLRAVQSRLARIAAVARRAGLAGPSHGADLSGR